MPTVSRSDCTQVDLTESIKIIYDSAKGAFSGRITSIEVGFNACQGINNRNNDLWAYMARLYYQGDITASQFGEAGRIITNEGCETAIDYQLHQKGLTYGYNYDSNSWTNLAGREALKVHDGYGNVAFKTSLVQDSDSAPNGILYRACASCEKTHKKIYYRRLTTVPEGFDLMTQILYRNAFKNGNVWNVDFTLHSTYEDALAGANPWKCPNNSFDYGAGFTVNCSPDGTRITDLGSIFDRTWERDNVAYYVNKAEGGGLKNLDTTNIRGQDYAGGVALQADDGTIYMTGSGRDIWYA